MKRTVDDKGFTLEEFLQNYKAKDYPKPSVTADIVLFSIKENKVQVLLIKEVVIHFLTIGHYPVDLLKVMKQSLRLQKGNFMRKHQLKTYLLKKSVCSLPQTVTLEVGQ